MCRKRLRCALFNDEARMALKALGPGVCSCPEVWCAPRESVLADEAKKHPEQLLAIYRESVWLAAKFLARKPPPRVSTIPAKFHAANAVLQELLLGARGARGRD